MKTTFQKDLVNVTTIAWSRRKKVGGYGIHLVRQNILLFYL